MNIAMRAPVLLKPDFSAAGPFVLRAAERIELTCRGRVGMGWATRTWARLPPRATRPTRAVRATRGIDPRRRAPCQDGSW
jgi:hypothetical protein